MISEGLRRRLDGTRFVLTAVVVVLFPLIGLPREDERPDLPPALSYFYAADVALIALAIVTLPRLVASARRARGAEGLSWLVFFGLVAIAFAVHPSARGFDTLLRLVAAAAIYRVICDLAPFRREVIAGALGLTAVLQAAIAALQFATGAPLGLRSFGELGDDLLTYGGPPLARGTVGEEFILAALALVTAVVLVTFGLRAARPAGWFLVAVPAISAAGFVYGRTVAICAALVCGSLVRPAARSGRHRWALAALLLGVGIPALVAHQGWASSFARGVGSDRGAMVGQALAIAGDEPLVGVGPGNYLDALEARPALHVTREIQNVHNVPFMLAAEAGLPAGVITAALLILVGWNAFRAGVPAITLYLAFVPWTILDVLPYVTPQGIVLTAVWLGFLQVSRAEALPVVRPRSR